MSLRDPTPGAQPPPRRVCRPIPVPVATEAAATTTAATTGTTPAEVPTSVATTTTTTTSAASAARPTQELLVPLQPAPAIDGRLEPGEVALPWVGAAIAVSAQTEVAEPAYWPAGLTPEARAQLIGPWPPTQTFHLDEWYTLVSVE